MALVSSCARLLIHRRFLRSFMSSSVNLAKVAEEELQNNPYYQKYAKKIHETAVKSPEEFESKLISLAESKRQPKKDEPKLSQVEYPEPRAAQGTFNRKKLNDIVNVDLIKSKTKKEIELIWKEYFQSKKDVIYASLPKENYQGFKINCEKYPTFIVPLPRGDGYEFFLTQYFDEEIHFAPLILYHKYKEDCPQCLCVSYFSELPQDVVLMLGEYDNKVLSPIEAQCLVNTIQLFYNTSERLELLEKFNKAPETFDYNDLIQHMNTLSVKP